VSVDVLPAAPGRERPRPADRRRRVIVVTVLLGVSTAMVYGTWLAADDMRAKPLVAQVTMQDGLVTIENTGTYAWQDVRLTIDGEYVCALTDPVLPGTVVGTNLSGCLSAAGRRLDWPEVPARQVAVVVTRVPRFPRLNRARTASGTYPLE
jgi:hypothetical protein